MTLAELQAERQYLQNLYNETKEACYELSDDMDNDWDELQEFYNEIRNIGDQIVQIDFQIANAEFGQGMEEICDRYLNQEPVIEVVAEEVVLALPMGEELDTSNARDFDFDTDELLQWEEEFSQPDPGVYTIEERQEQYQTILDYLRHYRELLRAMRRRFQSFLEYLVWLVMNFYRDQRHCYL